MNYSLIEYIPIKTGYACTVHVCIKVKENVGKTQYGFRLPQKELDHMLLSYMAVFLPHAYESDIEREWKETVS